MLVEVKKRDHKKKPYFTVFATEGNRSLYLAADSMRELNHKFVEYGCPHFGRETVPLLSIEGGERHTRAR